MIYANHYTTDADLRLHTSQYALTKALFSILVMNLLAKSLGLKIVCPNYALFC